MLTEAISKEELFEYFLKNVLTPGQLERAKLETSILGITQKRYARDETIQPDDIIYTEGVDLKYKEFMKLPAKQHITIMR